MKTIEGMSPDDERAVALFRALGNPARLRILREIAEREACVTGDLVDVLPLAQSTVSEHLAVLKEAGIVRGIIEGDPCYCLDPETLGWMRDYCAELATHADLCERTLIAESEVAAPAGQ